MRKSSVKKIYWGLLLIAIAVFVLLKCAGVDIGFVGILSVTDIILGAIVVSIMIGSLVERHFAAVPFELAVIFMLFEDEIAIALGKTGDELNLVSNWLVLLCALLVSAGLSLIFPSFGKSKNHVHISGDGKGTKFTSDTKYFDCTDCDKFYYSVKMGSCDIYFENTENYKGNGVLDVECKMGNITVHVPSEWHIVANIESEMGNVDIPSTGTPDGLLLTINGVNKMGNIDIELC